MTYIEINNKIHSDITETNYQIYKENHPIEFIGPIDKVNIFIGANNSGKSRFLRGLIKSNKFTLTNNSKSNKQTNSLLKNIKNVQSSLPSNKHISFSYNLKIVRSRINLGDNNIAPNEILKILELETLGAADQSFHLDSSFIEKIKNILEDIKKDKFHYDYNKTVLAILLNQLKLISYITNENHRDTHKSLKHKGILSFDYSLYRFNKLHIEKIEELSSNLELLLKTEITTESDINKIYIPILRTAHSLFKREKNQEGSYQKIEQNILEDSTIKNYSLDENDEVFTKINIATGLDLYQKIRRTRNNVKDIRENFSQFEEFLSTYFFDGKTVDIVALEDESSNKEHITIYIDGEDHLIHNLGDGIQSIIILMYTIYTAPENSWIFIEEPEINLHPGLQRIFLDQIHKNETLIKKNLKYFITTHSNHLLDVSIEDSNNISIFSFDKKNKDSSTIHEIKLTKSAEYDILKKLGVRNSSVLLSNCSIWVEGVTDRKYIKSFLEAYLKEHPQRKTLNEDLDYSFYEYAGSNLKHYIFNRDKNEEAINALSLSNRIFLIADKDENKDEKHYEYLNQQSKNFVYKFTDGREIENIISSTQFNKYAHLVFQSFKEQEFSFELEAYKDQYMGSYILDLAGKDKLSKNFKPGTLSSHYKNKLASVISKNMTWAEMSESAKKLTQRLYDFIRESSL